LDFKSAGFWIRHGFLASNFDFEDLRERVYGGLTRFDALYAYALIVIAILKFKCFYLHC